MYLSLLFAGLFSSNKQVLNGSQTLSNLSLDAVDVNGSLALEKLVVKGSLKVNGSINGNGLTCKRLDVNGSVTINNLKATDAKIRGNLSGDHINISGKTEISGGLSASESSFGDIKARSRKITLHGSNIKNIVFEKNDDDGNETLELNGSNVTGHVTFESGSGRIILKNGAKIQGSIKGGEIINHA